MASPPCPAFATIPSFFFFFKLPKSLAPQVDIFHCTKIPTALASSPVFFADKHGQSHSMSPLSTTTFIFHNTDDRLLLWTWTLVLPGGDAFMFPGKQELLALCLKYRISGLSLQSWNAYLSFLGDRGFQGQSHFFRSYQEFSFLCFSVSFNHWLKSQGSEENVSWHLTTFYLFSFPLSSFFFFFFSFIILGLTPPTTPPHKANQDNPFRASPKLKPSCKTVVPPPSKKARYSESSCTQGSNSTKKGPEQSELYAQLSKTSVLTSGHEERKAKRPSLRLFGDHDYCQSINSKMEILVSTSQELHDSRQLENKDAPSSNGSGQIHSSTDSDPCYLRETAEVSRQVSPGSTRKQLQDQEIRAELNKHFGHPSQAVFDDKADKTSELRDSDFSNEQFSKLPMFINSGLAMDGLFDDSEDESDKLNSPWDGTQSYSLFHVSPSCSSFNSPCRDSVSPPKSLFSQRPQRMRSRSRSFSRHRSCSRSPYSRSRSRSPGSRSSSR